MPDELPSYLLPVPAAVASALKSCDPAGLARHFRCCADSAAAHEEPKLAAYNRQVAKGIEAELTARAEAAKAAQEKS